MSSNTAIHSDNHSHEVGPGDPPYVHHMDSTTAYEAAKLGLWLFLATEILLFAVMFCCLALYKYYYLKEFHEASHHLNWKVGALNTAVLLFSSFTAALAVDAAQRGDNKRVSKNLIITIICGLIFLIVKSFEYTEKYHHGLFPGGANYMASNYKMFFGLYFSMTGLHALHVILGMGLLTWGLTKSLKNRFSPRYYTPVEIGALYWHLVDLIWIYLFPLLYLVG